MSLPSPYRVNLLVRKQIQQTDHRPRGATRKYFDFQVLRIISWPLFTTAIFMFTACITIYATDNDWILSRISTNYGILLLSLLSKSLDFGFDWGLKAVWEHWQRGPLMRARASLLVFLVMSSELKAWFKTLVFRKRRSISPDSPSVAKGSALWSRMMMSPRFWSSLRYVCLSLHSPRRRGH
jgi:hypothetical protein